MATDDFLEIEGIPGESEDAAFKNKIEVLSWSFGVTNSGTFGTGTGGGSGKANFQDFSFTMFTNKATPQLMLHCATGKHIPKAILICRKAGGEQQPYLEYTLSDVLVSSYQTGGSGGGGEVPIDTFSLNMAKIAVSYKAQKKDGSLDSPVKTGYDIKAAQPL